MSVKLRIGRNSTTVYGEFIEGDSLALDVSGNFVAGEFVEDNTVGAKISKVGNIFRASNLFEEDSPLLISLNGYVFTLYDVPDSAPEQPSWPEFSDFVTGSNSWDVDWDAYDAAVEDYNTAKEAWEEEIKETYPVLWQGSYLENPELIATSEASFDVEKHFGSTGNGFTISTSFSIETNAELGTLAWVSGEVGSDRGVVLVSGSGSSTWDLKGGNRDLEKLRALGLTDESVLSFIEEFFEQYPDGWVA